MPAHRMLTVFGAETAQAPSGLASPNSTRHHHHHEVTPQEDAEVRELLEKAFAGSGSSQREYPGKGCGFGYVPGPYVSYASKGGVYVMFTGEVSEWPGIDAVENMHNAFMSNVAPAERDDAHWLLDFYSSFSDTDAPHHNESVLQEALECLSLIKGSFAFVIYDSVFHRLLAARDDNATQPMYWGSTPDGKLMFGSAVEDLVACEPTATMFPAGSLFASARHTMAFNPGPEGWVIEGDDYPGELVSFVKCDEEHWRQVRAIPRITSKGCVTGAVYQVSSQPDLVHLAART